MNFLLTTTDEVICMKLPRGLVESLLSCHLYNIVIRATAAVLCTVMSVRLGQSCPQEAGGWIVEMGEETGCGGAGVRCRESPWPREERGGEHPGLREQGLTVVERKAWRQQAGHIGIHQVGRKRTWCQWRRRCCRWWGGHGDGGGSRGENGGKGGWGWAGEVSVPCGRLSQ